MPRDLSLILSPVSRAVAIVKMSDALQSVDDLASAEDCRAAYDKAGITEDEIYSFDLEATIGETLRRRLNRHKPIELFLEMKRGAA